MDFRDKTNDFKNIQRRDVFMPGDSCICGTKQNDVSCVLPGNATSQGCQCPNSPTRGNLFLFIPYLRNQGPVWNHLLTLKETPIFPLRKLSITYTKCTFHEQLSGCVWLLKLLSFCLYLSMATCCPWSHIPQQQKESFIWMWGKNSCAQIL